MDRALAVNTETKVYTSTVRIASIECKSITMLLYRASLYSCVQGRLIPSTGLGWHAFHIASVQDISNHSY